MTTPNAERIKKDEEELAALMKARTEEEEGRAPDPELEKAKAVMEDDNASDEDKTWAKRYSDTKSHYMKKEALKDKEIEELKAKIEEAKQKEPTEIPTDVAALAEFKKNNPEMATAIEKIAAAKAKEMQAELEGKVETLSKKDQKSTAALVKSEVVKAHPDFDELNGMSEFHDWVKEQDPYIEETLYRGLNAKNIIQAINLYKLENDLLVGKPDEKSVKADTKQAEAEAAKIVAKGKAETPPTPKSKLKESEIVKWTDEEFEANLAVYQKAKAEGNIIYDLPR